MNRCEWHWQLSWVTFTEQIGRQRARWLEWLPASLHRPLRT
jgi:hypothetical protein